MATQSAPVPAEFEEFAAPYVQSGRYANATEVLHAAMTAFVRTEDEDAYNLACLRAAEEGEASGEAEGDIFERIRAKYGWKPFAE
jgi:putative addiction module CopG family antidote